MISLKTTSWCEKHHLFVGFASSDTLLLLFQLLDSPVELPKCQGRFATRVENVRTAQISHWVLLKCLFVKNQAQNSQYIGKKKANGVLTRENQNTNNKSVEKI